MNWLCYYEIHVDDRTFIEHVVVEADDVEGAFEKLDKGRLEGEHYTRQPKGVCGELTVEMARQMMMYRPSVYTITIQKEGADDREVPGQFESHREAAENIPHISPDEVAVVFVRGDKSGHYYNEVGRYHRDDSWTLPDSYVMPKGAGGIGSYLKPLEV